MTYNIDGWGASNSGATGIVRLYTYISSTDAIATIVASGYFDDKINVLNVSDVIYINATDAQAFYYVTAVSPAVTIADVADAGDLALAQGNVFVGNASGVAAAVDLSAGGNILVGNDTTAVALDASADGQIVVGNGTTITSVAVSGDISLTNAGVTAVTSLDLETATVTNIADTEFMIGTGAGTANFAAFSGDVTVANTGAATVAALDLETATVTGITDTEIMIGTGAGTANFAAVSGDAAMTNAGVVTVNAADGDFTAGASGSGAFALGGITSSSGCSSGARYWICA